MRMVRTGLAALLLSASAACATQPALEPSARALQRAATEARILSEARDYARFAVARYASLTEDPDTAAYYYSKLTSSSPNDAILAERAIFSALLIGEIDRARDIAESLPTETIVQSELARLSLAVSALERGQNRTAQAWLDAGTWRSPFHTALVDTMRAWLQFPVDPDAAIAAQAEAGQVDLVLGRLAQTFAARMMVQSGREEKGRTALAALWDLNARTAFGVETEVRLLAASGDIAAARKRLRDFREDVGRHPALTELAAELDTSVPHAPAALTPAEGIARFFYASAAALNEQDAGDVSGVYFALALHLDPGLDAARSLWADALDKAGRHDEAIALLKRIPESSIYHTTAQGQLAWVLLRQGHDDDAIALARKTLKQAENRNIRIQLGDLLQSTGRLGEAEAVFTDVITADESRGVYDWRLFFARGSVREQLGFWATAENDLQTALGLNPDNPAILNYLGYSWIDRGENLQEGLDLIRKAHLIAPDSGAVTDSLGWALFQLGHYERAVLHLERAAELLPQDAYILDHLGDAYWQVGRYTEAGYQWQRALDNAENEHDRAVFAEKLENGAARFSSYESPSANVRP